MGKLYPPVIEGTLPAFYSENGMVKITIPFSMNRAVSESQVYGFKLRIKALQSGNVLFTVNAIGNRHYSMEQGNSYINFSFKDDNTLKVGQFYKVQLAYYSIKDNCDKIALNKLKNEYLNGIITQDEYSYLMEKQYLEEGYYTGTSVIKYTTKPKVQINMLKPRFINTYISRFTGSYSQENGDSTEKVYTYQFDVSGENGDIYWSSGLQLHNSNTDTELNYSEDVYDLLVDIKYDTLYYIQYTINTINGLTISSPKYKLVQREYIEPELYRTLRAEKNFDEGHIDLYLDGEITEQGVYSAITGSFILVRADETSNYSTWEELYRFKFNQENIKTGYHLYKDILLEQGKHYQYAIYQYNDNNLFSKKIYSDIIQADFEDAFMSDINGYQLKLKYNLKMSKFANTRLEAKQDTLGGQYPFIFRNGNVNYHEFQIQGLISYFMDEAHTFVPEEMLLTDEKTINYTTNNIAQERVFKRFVLEWLNDGTPKIFRSPTEGNFIVRLIKISLKPEQKLGRLLHNFSGTAYEIAEYNYKNLIKYGFIRTGDYDKLITQWETINVTTPGYIFKEQKFEDTTFLELYDFEPGTQIELHYNDDTIDTIVIGTTGRYLIENCSNLNNLYIAPIYRQRYNPNEGEYAAWKYYKQQEVEGKFTYTQLTPEINIHGKLSPPYSGEYGMYFYVQNQSLRGKIIINYLKYQENSYNMINNIIINDCDIQQFIGSHDIIKEITHVSKIVNQNKEYCMDIKKQISKLYGLSLKVRPIEYYYEKEKNSDNLIYDANNISRDKIHPFSLYKQINGNIVYEDFTNNPDASFDCDTDDFLLNDMSHYYPQILLNGELINITHDTYIDLNDINVESLYTRNGVVAELIYQTKTIEYKIEDTFEKILETKRKYEEALNKYWTGIKNMESPENLNNLVETINNIYFELNTMIINVLGGNYNDL